MSLAAYARLSPSRNRTGRWNITLQPPLLRGRVLADAASLLFWRVDLRNNEVVIDTRSIERNLPGMVLAFFYRVEPTSEAGERRT